MHVKGRELLMHDPHGKVGVGLGYAVAEHGADDMTAHAGRVWSGSGPVAQGPGPGGQDVLRDARLGPRDRVPHAGQAGGTGNWLSTREVTVRL